jgi:hypothetical protein
MQMTKLYIVGSQFHSTIWSIVEQGTVEKQKHNERPQFPCNYDCPYPTIMLLLLSLVRSGV